MGLNNWEDLTPAAITVVKDDTQIAWDVSVNGPLTEEKYGRGQYEVLGIPYLVVGPTENAGEFTSIQDALNALEYSRHSGLLLLDGTYSLTAPIYLPDRNVDIKGESQGGVVIENNPGDDCFVLHNLTKTYKFSTFTFDSQTISSYKTKFNIYGDTYADNTASVMIKEVTFKLDSSVFLDGGINIDKVSGTSIDINNCVFTGAYYATRAYQDIYAQCRIVGCRLNDVYVGFHSNSKVKLDVLNNVMSNVWSTGILLPGASGVFLISGNYISINPATTMAPCHVQATGSSKYGKIQNNDLLVSGIALTALKCIHLNGQSHIVSQNTILADITTAGAMDGIYADGLTDGQIANNSIKLDNDDTTVNHNGIHLINSDRNIVHGNNINMVNNDTKDIGILLDTSSDNNYGGDNLTYHCGTSISDASANNGISAMDI